MLLIGCGNIGEALLKLWVSGNVVSDHLYKNVVVVQPSLSSAGDFSQYQFIKFIDDIKDIPANFVPMIIVLAIKPQIADKVIPNLVLSEKTIVISMLAGTKLGRLLELTSGHKKIVRMMPTVAVKTGRSVNLLFANENSINDEDLLTVKSLFEPSGKIVRLKNEDHIDLLTPISGSGPAYFFLLSEILIEEVVKLGIDKDTAFDIIHEVFVGCASLADNGAPADFASLRESVTSKGGVTEAALKIMSPEMRDVIQRSLQSAIARLKEL
jgi:pyrroline-5-carboxylate reductase